MNCVKFLAQTSSTLFIGGVVAVVVAVAVAVAAADADESTWIRSKVYNLRKINEICSIPYCSRSSTSSLCRVIDPSKVVKLLCSHRSQFVLYNCMSVFVLPPIDRTRICVTDRGVCYCAQLTVLSVLLQPVAIAIVIVAVCVCVRVYILCLCYKKRKSPIFYMCVRFSLG